MSVTARPSVDLTAKPYLRGHYEPVVDEITATELQVHGTLPTELEGRYFRNSHNPMPGVTPTNWFAGSGMIHGVRLRAGKAEWYRNRWVRTPALEGVPYRRADGSIDLTASVAGTNVIEHAGRILALQEQNLPFELTRDLDTVGPYDFAGKLQTSMTAHPKEDPVSGELHFFSWSPFPPHVTYYVADRDGDVVRAEAVPGAGPTLQHDFGLTASHVVWLDMSLVFDHTAAGLPFSWSETYTPRIGVMPRTGPATVRWFEIEPGALLHVGNAYEDAEGNIVVDGPRYDRSAWEVTDKFSRGAPGWLETPNGGAVATRWVLDLTSGKASQHHVDDFVTEFPSINEDYLGRQNRYSYAMASPGGGLDGYAVVKLDATTGQTRIAETGPDRMPGEAVFVPAQGASREDDGYLMTLVSDIAANASALLVLDAGSLETIAAVELPRRVPSGIHGNWIPDADLH
ncbi:carotenoid oxygenase family protein [Motilibacter aurantiacus]|uniref:carotenoid oxygenase family protein n=1 Tax=Motilibacter aurantiacus TaxID=2714955 RepID=UPI00140914BA|nr:carotenoid oxygenase family protein [Motilibacter aurantiacus]NHC45335.1 dioxygenase [Motilibacter aurantiacus]